MAKRCGGITRAGKPCSITSSSLLTNDSGRFAAEPLKRGGEYRLFHARPFQTRPCETNGRGVLETGCFLGTMLLSGRWRSG